MYHDERRMTTRDLYSLRGPCLTRGIQYSWKGLKRMPADKLQERRVQPLFVTEFSQDVSGFARSYNVERGGDGIGTIINATRRSHFRAAVRISATTLGTWGDQMGGRVRLVSPKFRT